LRWNGRKNRIAYFHAQRSFLKTEEGFQGLFAMSSYDHVEEKTAYPAVLLETGMNDPRIAPWEIGKMAARLEAATSSGRTGLIAR
jgi:prolyl oligopeptidase